MVAVQPPRLLVAVLLLLRALFSAYCRYLLLRAFAFQLIAYICSLELLLSLLIADILLLRALLSAYWRSLLLRAFAFLLIADILLLRALLSAYCRSLLLRAFANKHGFGIIPRQWH